MNEFKRLAPGFYVTKAKNGTFTYIVKDGRWWRTSKYWMNEFTPDKKHTIAALSRANHFIYPTLAAAISALRGNRAS